MDVGPAGRIDAAPWRWYIGGDALRRRGLALRFPYLMPGLPAPELVLAYDFRHDVASL